MEPFLSLLDSGHSRALGGLGGDLWEGWGTEPLPLSYWPGAQQVKDSSEGTHLTTFTSYKARG